MTVNPDQGVLTDQDTTRMMGEAHRAIMGD